MHCAHIVYHLPFWQRQLRELGGAMKRVKVQVVFVFFFFLHLFPVVQRVLGFTRAVLVTKVSQSVQWSWCYRPQPSRLRTSSRSSGMHVSVLAGRRSHKRLRPRPCTLRAGSHVLSKYAARPLADVHVRLAASREGREGDIEA